MDSVFLPCQLRLWAWAKRDNCIMLDSDNQTYTGNQLFSGDDRRSGASEYMQLAILELADRYVRTR